MKKLLSLLFIVLLLLLVLWGAATWFLAQETEKMLTTLSDKNQSTTTTLTQNGFEITDYKNTSFLAADATLRLNSSIPLLDNLLSDTDIQTKIQHGPLIVDASGVTFAASKITAQLDLASFDEETRAVLTQLFADKTPLEAEIIMDFSEQAHYRIKVPTLSQAGETSLDMDGLTLVGTHSLDTKQGSATLDVGEIHMQDSSLEIIMPTVNAVINIDGFAGSQMLGTSQLHAKNIKIKPMGSHDIRFDIQAETRSKQSEQELVGDLKFNVENINESSETIKHIAYTLDYKGLSIAGLDELTVVERKLENLQNQLAWNMEATENPEGQEKMLALVEQMQQASQEMLNVFFNKVLIAKKSQLQQSLAISSDTAQSTLKNDFIYTGLDNQQTVNTDKILLGDLSDVLTTIAGTLAIKLDKSMLPDLALIPLNAFVSEGIAKSNKDTFTLDASLTDGKITLNGTSFTFDEFIAKFVGNPEATVEDEASLAAQSLPEDMQQRLQAEGLSPEIMQTLEESEDIDPEVLKILQDVYKENSQTINQAPATVSPEIAPENSAPSNPADSTDAVTTNQPLETIAPAPAQ